MSPSRTVFLMLVAAIGASTATARAQQAVYQTNSPFGSFFGFVGFDVLPSQSVAVRFTPTQDVRLSSVRPWFMSNDFASPSRSPVILSLRGDINPGGQYNSAPAATSMETWSITIRAIGWDPIQESVQSVAVPLLRAGVRYWVVAESPTAVSGDNPVWVWAANDSGFAATTQSGQWQSGSGAVAAIEVFGTAVPAACNLADITGVGGPPATPDGLLTGDDFNAFIAAFASGSLLADVTGIGGPPAQPDGLITGDDFNAFVAAFAAGCP